MKGPKTETHNQFTALIYFNNVSSTFNRIQVNHLSYMGICISDERTIGNLYGEKQFDDSLCVATNNDNNNFLFTLQNIL